MTNTSQKSETDFFRIHFFVFGKVQGVGFRNFIKKEAKKLSLSGRVRNRSDGSVEVVAIGGKKPIDIFLEKMKPTGPRWAKVTQVKITSKKITTTDPLGTFEKSPTV